jgi:hypothetical protein
MKQPCNQCPFRRNSLPGYLGEASYNPEEFLQTIEHSPIPCHRLVDWSADDSQIQAELMKFEHPCIGALQFLKNSCKLPHDSKYIELRNSMEQNENVFQFRHEFINHHNKK